MPEHIVGFRFLAGGYDFFGAGNIYKRYYDKKYLQLIQTTIESDIMFVHNVVHVVSTGKDPMGKTLNGQYRCRDARFLKK